MALSGSVQTDLKPELSKERRIRPLKQQLPAPGHSRLSDSRWRNRNSTLAPSQKPLYDRRSNAADLDAGPADMKQASLIYNAAQ